MEGYRVVAVAVGSYSVHVVVVGGGGGTVHPWSSSRYWRIELSCIHHCYPLLLDYPFFPPIVADVADVADDTTLVNGDPPHRMDATSGAEAEKPSSNS